MLQVIEKLEQMEKRNERNARGIIATGDEDLINDFQSLIDEMNVLVQKIQLMLGKKK